MTFIRISEPLRKLAGRALKCSPTVALLLVATFSSAVPARAQSSDSWKSVAIIGGSTAAGAYIGHKVAGSTGAYVGAAAGAATGYAIDRRRRQNEYNNGYYGNNGPYGDNGGYYGNGDPNYGNGGYYGNGYPPPSGYPSGYFRSGHRGR
jgi:hypothetical protein